MNVTTLNKVGKIRDENYNGNSVEREERWLIVFNYIVKTSLESLRIIFAWFRGKTATRWIVQGNEKGWRGKFSAPREPFVSDFNVYSTIFVYRKRKREHEIARERENEFVCYLLNVHRINYHKNALVMRINIKSKPDH